MRLRASIERVAQISRDTDSRGLPRSTPGVTQTTTSLALSDHKRKRNPYITYYILTSFVVLDARSPLAEQMAAKPPMRSAKGKVWSTQSMGLWADIKSLRWVVVPSALFLLPPFIIGSLLFTSVLP